MHENLKYLGEGAVLLKRLVAGPCSRSTVRSTLEANWKRNWKRSRGCIVETSPGVTQVVRNLSIKRGWDLTYKQLWIFVLRNFADLGGRAPRKEKGEASYKASENPRLLHGFLEFIVDLGGRYGFDHVLIMTNSIAMSTVNSGPRRTGKIAVSLQSV